MLSKLFHEATVIVLKSKAVNGHNKNEKDMPVSLVNIDAKVMNKILASQIKLMNWVYPRFARIL